MKKIVLLLMPMLLVIAIVFYITERDFDTHSFLQFISTLRFTNLMEDLENIQDIWGETTQTFGSLVKPKDPVSFIGTILEGVINLSRTGLAIGQTVFNLITDCFTNVSKIFNWLFVA